VWSRQEGVVEAKRVPSKSGVSKSSASESGASMVEAGVRGCGRGKKGTK
jgi:hypothetical protein